MCGIAGALSFNPARFSVTEPRLIAMRDAMVHRGPDGKGVWVGEEGRIGFAHRRLSIIDLSSLADQPMRTADGALTIVFNGEIYNHADLRRELIELGHRDWRTDHSDTEVIMMAFRQWGIDCIHRFRGIFAFALWDARARSLWLVRDRLGVKPLYYAQEEDGIVFASEIKALLTDPHRTRAVDEQALFHYLSFLTTPAPQTLFAGIRKLRAGGLMRIDVDGSIVERQWWDVLDFCAPQAGKNDDSPAEQVLDELRAAVSLRKVAEVPVGVFLSGGVDSSANLALLSEGENDRPKAFSIAYADDQASVSDEMPFARMMAQQTGAEHFEHTLTENDLFDFLPHMIELQDEPIADPVCVPVYYVSKLARENGVVVAQIGEGADELFCGYPSWQKLLQLEQFNNWPVPKALKQAGFTALSAAGFGDRSPDGVAAARRPGSTAVLGWRRGIHRRRKTKIAVAAAAPQIRGRHIVGCDRAVASAI